MTELSAERADLLQTLGMVRHFLAHTAEGLTDEQARSTPTASELSVGGIIKHVTATERGWQQFVLEGAPDGGAGGAPDEAAYAEYAAQFQLLPDETLAEILADFTTAGERTAELVRTVDLDASQPLPEAPWFEPGAAWTARRVFTHLVAETAQHAGHADIIRETIDGQKSMG